MYQIESKKEALKPRERLVDRGAENLSNQELLAILLRTGTRKESVLHLSTKILDGLDSLSEFGRLSLQELRKISGIGEVKSIEIKAMLEFSKRIRESEESSTERILSSEKVAQKMMRELGELQQEHLVALYLDTQNRIIEQRTIFIGSVRRSIAEPREILHYACRNMATSLIVVHNHPSGAVQPSENDRQFTEKIKRSCEAIGIICLDHIIVGKKAYYSFREENDLL
ncbi:RadC family protein [Streptococcus saliviloxodontae]|uniref:DNA repair protein RadC n=1 Tax=Streptococcus saliviloxodontae TaxID=1349416 RepID=A0ABS2PL54_9STRE|nr:DNA repair protein RadC [Streptococcus saliviloxodontae]MBM7636104.1 DNA repair protein RadC [Streptococcus saliviloxodontae]